MPNEIERHTKAEQIRSVIRYIKRFNNAVIVIYIDDEIIDSPLFSSHIRDISLMLLLLEKRLSMNLIEDLLRLSILGI